MVHLSTGFFLSIAMAFALRPRTPPHWVMQIVLVPAAFIMSIVWLNIIATEVVCVLQAVGLLLSIDTGRYKTSQFQVHRKISAYK